MTRFTPTATGSFLAGISFWCLGWIVLFFEIDTILSAVWTPRIPIKRRLDNWIMTHKTLTLATTEFINYASQGGVTRPESVIFALGGTCVNIFMIFLVLPILRFLDRRKSIYLNPKSKMA